MTRAVLQWNDIRPTLLRATGRSGVEYSIYQIAAGPPARWDLFRFATPDDEGAYVSTGWLADMKALAEEAERDAVGEAPTPQRIAWTKLKPGHYRGVSSCGLAYRILQVGSIWQLEQFANEDAEHGTLLDEGSLAAMKAAAQRDAADTTLAKAGGHAQGILADGGGRSDV